MEVVDTHIKHEDSPRICAGVGLNRVQGALSAGAHKIIAVDIKQNKLEFGAAEVINSPNQDPIAAIHELTGGDVARSIIAFD